MIIRAGSTFGVQLGAIGTTYARDSTVKLIMAMIMLVVLVSRLVQLPVYLWEIGLLPPVDAGTHQLLETLSFATLALALVSGAGAILLSMHRGLTEHRRFTTTPTQAAG